MAEFITHYVSICMCRLCKSSPYTLLRDSLHMFIWTFCSMFVPNISLVLFSMFWSYILLVFSAGASRKIMRAQNFSSPPILSRLIPFPSHSLRSRTPSPARGSGGALQAPPPGADRACILGWKTPKGFCWEQFYVQRIHFNVPQNMGRQLPLLPHTG